MSAAEIIELIKKLPPEEKAEVIAFARAQEEERRLVRDGGLAAAELRVPKDEEFERAAEKVFAENQELLRRLAQ